MNLFDDIVRSYYEPSLYAEAQFSYMNRSARDDVEAIRQKLEEWFSHYPKLEQPELRSSFRSELDTQHQSAFFELFLHELMIKLDCRVTPHPPIPNTTKTPDFLVEPSDADSFYIEAVLATYESADEVAAESRKNIVYDILNREVASSDFYLWLRLRGTPATPPPAKKIASFVNSRLAKLDPDEVSLLHEKGRMADAPCWIFEHDGWIIDFRPIPKKPEARKKEGVRPLGAFSSGEWTDSRTPLLEAITKKAGRYGKLNLPYIVAVNSTEFVDEIDVTEALFGKEQFNVFVSETKSREPVEPLMSRVLDGAWTSPEGPRYTRVSAVLLAIRLSPWNIAQCDVSLYHNPWAQKPYRSVLNRLPQAIVESNHIKRMEGVTIAEIFDIPESWPMDVI